MEIILILIYIFVGIGIGCLITRSKTKPETPETSGYIRIDRSEPDEPPRLFLETSIGIYELSQKKYVTYEVKVENYISHE